MPIHRWKDKLIVVYLCDDYSAKKWIHYWYHNTDESQRNHTGKKKSKTTVCIMEDFISIKHIVTEQLPGHQGRLECVGRHGYWRHEAMFKNDACTHSLVSINDPKCA